ncbi:hypothetical protein MTR_8g467840 [Medicago truncatula]|uniref:Uncharacterized protein n=1 Tax=Medicago truncatula TaxID=3880 RepID=A0A072TQH8_MEDTR|nr:hypothetical protein MTR_8g467840 [Medicago truncatula]
MEHKAHLMWSTRLICMEHIALLGKQLWSTRLIHVEHITHLIWSTRLIHVEHIAHLMWSTRLTSMEHIAHLVIHPYKIAHSVSHLNDMLQVGFQQIISYSL